MTAAASPSPPGPLTMWLAHRLPFLAATAVATTIAVFVVPDAPAVVAYLLRLASLVSAAATIAGVAATWRHEFTLCWRCARHTPLDPDAEVERHARALRMYHWLMRGPVLLALIGVGVADIALLAFGPWEIAWPLGAAVWLWIALETAVALRHRPLQPWCPQCRDRWGGGGDHEVTPDPTPTPGGVRR